MARKWNITNDQSNAKYDAENEIIYNTEVLKCNLCKYSDDYILVRGSISIVGDNGTQVACKNWASCTKCITKIDGTTIDDAKDIGLIMSMYNLLCSLWFNSKDEATDFNANIANTVAFNSFMYKAKLLRETDAQPAPNNDNRILKNATTAVPLKYLSNFWRSLEMPLINCKVELKLKWKKHCVLDAAGIDNINANDNNIIFTIKDTKLYDLVVSLLAKDNQKLSKLLSKGF